MTIDGDRAAVYAAETAAFDGTDLEQVIGVEAVIEAVRAVCAGEWWPGRTVRARPARRDARSSSARCSIDVGTEIRIAASQATIATGAHELAHALASVEAGHGAEFRRAHLDVVSVMTNLDRLSGRKGLHVQQLAAAYSAASLTIGTRSWRPPPEPGAAIAL